MDNTANAVSPTPTQNHEEESHVRRTVKENYVYFQLQGVALLLSSVTSIVLAVVVFLLFDNTRYYHGLWGGPYTLALSILTFVAMKKRTLRLMRILLYASAFGILVGIAQFLISTVDIRFTVVAKHDFSDEGGLTRRAIEMAVSGTIIFQIVLCIISCVNIRKIWRRREERTQGQVMTPPPPDSAEPQLPTNLPPQYYMCSSYYGGNPQFMPPSPQVGRMPPYPGTQSFTITPPPPYGYQTGTYFPSMLPPSNPASSLSKLPGSSVQPGVTAPPPGPLATMSQQPVPQFQQPPPPVTSENNTIQNMTAPTLPSSFQTAK